MVHDVEQLLQEEKCLAAFLASMKEEALATKENWETVRPGARENPESQRNQENLALARKALRHIKSYSTPWENEDGQPGYRIRLKDAKEERTHEYAFSPMHEAIMDKVSQRVNLATGTTGFLENTEGYLFHYLARRGIQAHGFAMTDEAWGKSLLANFPVYRREYLRKPLPPLHSANHHLKDSRVPALDRLIWLVGDDPDEAPFVADLYRKTEATLLVFVPEGVTFSQEAFPGHVVEAEEVAFPGGESRFFFIAPQSPEPYGEARPKETTTIPAGLQVLESPSLIFQVDMEKCRDNNGFLYTQPGHYFVETLRQYEAGECMEYQGSFLEQYYDRFQPQNRRDNYLLEKDGDIFPLDQGWLHDPWRKPGNPPLRKERFETRKGGNHNLGPNTHAFGQAEFHRLVNAYNILKAQGYHPDLYVDGYITGYLLVRKNDYRFIASEGQHRIAALAALGYKTLVCRFDLKPFTEETVFYNQAHKWPQVKAGIFRHRVATLCFEHFFRQDNNQRLLEKTKQK